MRLFNDVRKHLMPRQLGVVAGDSLYGAYHRSPVAVPRTIWFALGGIALAVALLAAAPRHSAAEADADQLLHRAAAGSSSSQLMLGLAYRDGRYGLPRDSHAAAGWLTRAAQSGNAYAAAMLGDAYARGEGVALDLNAAQNWWRQAALAGNVHAESRLGLSLASRSASQAQRDESRRWLQRAAVGGDAQARQALGIEVPIATPVADQIDRDLGVTQGHSLMGDVERVALDDNPSGQSIADLKQRALSGDNVAEFQLAMRYRDGAWGVDTDPKLALIWLQRAAEHGNPVAMDSLAEAYGQGHLDLMRNPAEAAAWHRRADLARAEPLAGQR